MALPHGVGERAGLRAGLMRLARPDLAELVLIRRRPEPGPVRRLRQPCDLRLEAQHPQHHAGRAAGDGRVPGLLQTGQHDPRLVAFGAPPRQADAAQALDDIGPFQQRAAGLAGGAFGIAGLPCGVGGVAGGGVMAAEGLLAGGEGDVGVDDGHGMRRLLRSVRVHPAPRPGYGATLRSARICVRARAGVGAGAVRAPDCPHARQAQDALRLSAESGSVRTGSARAGSGPRGLRLPWTHHSTGFPDSDPKRRNITYIS